MTAAVAVWTRRRWSLLRSLAIGLGLCVAVGLLFSGGVALFA